MPVTDYQGRRDVNPSSSTALDEKNVLNDVLEYCEQYARQNPGRAALYCFGVGFVLGWKLKPW